MLCSYGGGGVRQNVLVRYVEGEGGLGQPYVTVYYYLKRQVLH